MQASISKKELTVLCLGLGILLIIILINSRSPYFDEVLYLRDVAILHKYGFSDKFLINLTGSAGPLYAVVHYLFEPLTQLAAPYVRLVNFFFLLGVLYFLERTLLLLGYSPRYYSLYCLAIPMTYIIAGLALTEMPALFFLTAGLYLTVSAANNHLSASNQLMQLIAGGICIGIAITGRQPYLLLIAALPILFMTDKWKSNIFKVVVLIIFALSLPAYVFWVWKDLVPPTDAIVYNDIAEAGTSYRLDFFFLCLAYFAAVLLLIAPDLYKKPNKKTSLLLGVAFILLLALNFIFQWIVFLPFHSVTKKIFLSEASQVTASIFFGTVMAFIAIYLLYIFMLRIWKANLPKEMLFYLFALVLIAVSCAKITWGFSSRYPAQAIPLLIPVGAYFHKKKESLGTMTMVIGIAVGVLALISHILSE